MLLILVSFSLDWIDFSKLNWTKISMVLKWTRKPILKMTISFITILKLHLYTCSEQLLQQVFDLVFRDWELFRFTWYWGEFAWSYFRACILFLFSLFLFVLFLFYFYIFRVLIVYSKGQRSSFSQFWPWNWENMQKELKGENGKDWVNCLSKSTSLVSTRWTEAHSKLFPACLSWSAVWDSLCSYQYQQLWAKIWPHSNSSR